MDGLGLLSAQQWLLKWGQKIIKTLLVPAITHHTESFIILDVYFFLNLTLSYLTCNSLFSACF